MVDKDGELHKPNKMLLRNLFKILSCWGRSDHTAGRALASHAVDPGSIPSTPCGPPGLVRRNMSEEPGVTPEHHQV